MPQKKIPLSKIRADLEMRTNLRTQHINQLDDRMKQIDPLHELTPGTFLKVCKTQDRMGKKRNCYVISVLRDILIVDILRIVSKRTSICDDCLWNIIKHSIDHDTMKKIVDDNYVIRDGNVQISLPNKVTNSIADSMYRQIAQHKRVLQFPWDCLKRK